ncbi:hypothetical protein DPX16_22618 [Anabarilius grahami]|uniref:Uncharacterized protein n=1 Tax=Anabarilius grahami TaxID=495550 RepID=A0A3N0XIS4_ANAGA|nr:hypothetical protein DPX16_22618 [Anabarilius grahami]
MEIEAQTRPRKFLANETKKESKDKFDMRKEECDEMMRIRQRTIRWWMREKKSGLAVKLKLLLALRREPQTPLAEGCDKSRFIRWRSLEPGYFSNKVKDPAGSHSINSVPLR